MVKLRFRFCKLLKEWENINVFMAEPCQTAKERGILCEGQQQTCWTLCGDMGLPMAAPCGHQARPPLGQGMKYPRGRSSAWGGFLALHSVKTGNYK